MNHECSGAVPTKGAEKAECVTLSDSEVSCEDLPCFSFGKQTIQEGADDPLWISLLCQWKGEGENGHTKLIPLESL